VFEIDPNTVLGWLVEAVEQLHAFSAYFLHEWHWFRLMQSSMCFALGNCLNKENLIER